MNIARARFLVILAMSGLLTIGAIAVFATFNQRPGGGRSLAIENCGPRRPQGTVVRVSLSDRGGAMMGDSNSMMVSIFASPQSIHEGTVTLLATNVGALDHELLVLPIPPKGVGTRSVGADGRIDEIGSLGEASSSCGPGAGAGIAPGTTSWVTLHLSAGNYELICDEPWHYANGMFTRLIVS